MEKNKTTNTGVETTLCNVITLLQYREVKRYLTLPSVCDKICLLGCSILPKNFRKKSNFMKYTQNSSNILFQVYYIVKNLQWV